MNAIELFHQDLKPAGVFYCGECRIVAKSKQLADLCCAGYKCDLCGVECGRTWLRCEPCRQKEEIRRESERFTKAEKVTQWDGPVFSDGHGCSDGYFSSVDDLRDWFDGEGEPLPEYVWTCSVKPVVDLNYESIVENATQEAYDGFDPDMLVGAEELKSALETFNTLNKETVNWTPNMKRALVLSSDRR